MRWTLLAISIAGLASGPAQARHREAAPPPRAYEDQISRYALMHGVPESLVHRVIVRESRYNPRLVGHSRHFGLMQISYATARSMGYSGTPAGLLDVDTNLAYAVPYLANAYRAAGQNETGAIRLYSSGYYYTAKRRGLLPQMRTAASPSLDVPPPAPPTPSPRSDNPFLQLFGVTSASEPVEATAATP
jgi:soluble lytic murein transglycosylase-like protein